MNKEIKGKDHSFRMKWLSIVFAMTVYIGYVISAKELPGKDQVWGIIAIATFIFICSLPVDVSFWIQNAKKVIDRVIGEEGNGTKPPTA
jgi:hypothetical protein